MEAWEDEQEDPEHLEDSRNVGRENPFLGAHDYLSRAPPGRA